MEGGRKTQLLLWKLAKAVAAWPYFRGARHTQYSSTPIIFSRVLQPTTAKKQCLDVSQGQSQHIFPQ
jgi:hypothetical protein